MKKGIALFIGILITMLCSAQEKELLIIGTMHTVPSIVKNSYKPLLKYVVKYEPEAIFVEYIHPDDTLSINAYTPTFLEKSDSLNQNYQFDEKYFIKIKIKVLQI